MRLFVTCFLFSCLLHEYNISSHDLHDIAKYDQSSRSRRTANFLMSPNNHTENQLVRNKSYIHIRPITKAESNRAFDSTGLRRDYIRKNQRKQKGNHTENRRSYDKYHAFSDLDSPVIFLGIAKSGTTSLTHFFRNLNIGCHHWSMDDKSFCLNNSVIRSARVENRIFWTSKHSMYRYSFCVVAMAIQAAIANKEKPLKYVLSNHTTVITQMDYCDKDSCVFPQIDSLNMIMDAYPNAYYVNNHRPIKDHSNSIMNWNDFAVRLENAGLLERFPGQAKVKERYEKVEIFLRYTYDKIQNAFKERPHYKTLNLNLIHQNASDVLKKFLGLSDNSNVTIPFVNVNKKTDSTIYGA